MSLGTTGDKIAVPARPITLGERNSRLESQGDNHTAQLRVAEHILKLLIEQVQEIRREIGAPELPPDFYTPAEGTDAVTALKP